MSVNKLMSRIIAPKSLEGLDDKEAKIKAAHDHTYGITSDPLTQFACAFSALIHDVGTYEYTYCSSCIMNAPIVSQHRNLSSFYYY